MVDLVLRSPLAALDEQDQNNIHVNRNVIDMIVTSLKFGQIEADQFRVDADPFKYPFRDFVMQYEESLLSFIRRQLAREGLALYIDHSGSLEKAVIVDPSDSFPALLDGANELQLGWVGNSKAADKADFPAFFDMTRETRVPPKRLILRDYNWEDPNKPLQVDLTVSPLGRGTLHYYGENFSTEGEGERLASVIKEEALSSSDIVKIQTNIPGAMPGLTLEVKGHPSPSINDRYLVARSEFCGSQEDKISKELKYDFDSDIDYGFHNLVELRRLTSPYRPPRMESRPKVAGSITAWIDGETDRRDINLDERGRYKVILPLDVSGRRLGEASAWVRMAQPSVGKGYGQNFPLAHGTEVLLTFIDGNPDRPVISGAVADAQTKGLVSGSCQNLGGIGARGGGALIFDEVQSGDNLTLANGTSRAGLTITSDAPATTVIHSDYLNTLSAGAINLNASFSRSMAGQEYTVKASNRRLSEALSMIGLNKYIPDAN